MTPAERVAGRGVLRTEASRSPGDPGSVGVVETRRTRLAGGRPFRLEGGGSLSPATLAYETYGRLDPDGSNAVLVCHALSGSAHAAGFHGRDDERAGWWDALVGPGKGIDTRRWFVVSSNVLGSCYGSTGPASRNPATGEAYGLDFPVVTVGDMVRAQAALLDELGIERLRAVIGGSLGGMQVLEWVRRFPGRVEAAVPIATTARHSPMQIALGEVGRQAIYADPRWRDGGYHRRGEAPADGLAVARMVGHLTYLSPASMERKFGRRLREGDRPAFDFGVDFEVESYLRYNGRKFTERFDANSYLYLTKAMDYFDLTDGSGSLTPAFARSAGVRTLGISFTGDWLYPPGETGAVVEALRAAGADAAHLEVESDWGHDAFLVEVEEIAAPIARLLEAR